MSNKYKKRGKKYNNKGNKKRKTTKKIFEDDELHPSKIHQFSEEILLLNLEIRELDDEGGIKTLKKRLINYLNTKRIELHNY